MKVVLVFRSKKLGYHSIENVFDAVRAELKNRIDIEALYVPHTGFNVSNIFWLRKMTKNNPPDTIYHVTGDVHYVVFGLPKKRTILTIHDCVFIKRREGMVGWALKKLFLDWPLRYVSRITTISEKSKAEILSNARCDADKIKVINNPVGSQLKHVSKIFNAAQPVLLFIGSLPNKNLNRVIEALNGFRCILHIIGEVQAHQRNLLDRYNIQNVIRNHISNAEMAREYQQADIVVFPSLYEGFGLPIIEGFKSGRAVLTSNLSPMKEVADGAAWLVDPYSKDSIRNTLEQMVHDDEARNRKIRNGLLISEHYEPSNIAASYYDTYRDLLFNKNARPRRDVAAKENAAQN